MICLFAAFNTSIAQICECVGLLAVKQILGLCKVMNIDGCPYQGVDQSDFGIDSNVDLNPYVEVISVVHLVNLRISRPLPFLV